MIVKPASFSLRDGRALLARSPEAADAKTMCEYLLATAEETHFLVRYPEETSTDLEEEAHFLQKIAEAESDFMLAAFDGQKVAGNVAVSGISARYKMAHRAELGIAVRKEYWHEGIGQWLMKAAITKARWVGYEQLELGVFADNARATALYKKLGFSEYGRVPRAFRMKDGTYIDEVLMSLQLG